MMKKWIVITLGSLFVLGANILEAYETPCSQAELFTCNTARSASRPLFDWGGHIEAGLYSNQYGNTNHDDGQGIYANGPLGVRGIPNFNLNQLWLWAGREADTKKHGFDFGWRTDLVFGTDYTTLQAGGSNFTNGIGEDKKYWDSDWGTGDYGLAMPQLYVEFSLNHFKTKVGHFFSPIGYESASAAENDFYSQTYFGYYGAPTTMSGFLVERDLNSRWNVFAGWINGWDTGLEHRFDDSMFVGGIKWTPSKRTTLSYGFIGGTIERSSNALNMRTLDNGIFYATKDIKRYLHTLTWEFQVSDRLRLVTEGNYAEDGTNISVNGGAYKTSWYGISQHLIYTINSKWSVGGRFEWFRDDAEHSVYRTPETYTSQYDAVPVSYYSLTAGVTWRPFTNLAIRPEIRYDWSEGVNAFDRNVSGQSPYLTSGRSSQISGGFDLVYTFR